MSMCARTYTHTHRNHLGGLGCRSETDPALGPGFDPQKCKELVLKLINCRNCLIKYKHSFTFWVCSTTHGKTFWNDSRAQWWWFSKAEWVSSSSSLEPMAVLNNRERMIALPWLTSTLRFPVQVVTWSLWGEEDPRDKSKDGSGWRDAVLLRRNIGSPEEEGGEECGFQILETEQIQEGTLSPQDPVGHCCANFL